MPYGVGVPHGADGRRRGFSISHDAVVSMVAIGESLGYLRRPGALRPPALSSADPWGVIFFLISNCVVFFGARY